MIFFPFKVEQVEFKMLTPVIPLKLLVSDNIAKFLRNENILLKTRIKVDRDFQL